MRFGRIILVFLLPSAWMVGGCSGPQYHWPWEQNQVPVTQPKEQAKYAPPPQSIARAADPPKAPAARTLPAGTSPGQAIASATPAARTADPPTPAAQAAPPVANPVAPAPAPVRPAPPVPADPPAPAVPTAPLEASMLPRPIRLEDLPALPARVLQPGLPQPPRPQPSPGAGAADTAPPLPYGPAATIPGMAGPAIAPPPSGGPEVVSTLGFQVNNKYVTVEDILRSEAGALAQIPRGLPLAAFRSRAAAILIQAIQDQIEIAAVLPEAESKVADEETKRIDEQVDRVLRGMIDEAGGSRKKLEEIWIERGTTLELVLKEYRNKFVVMQYLQSKFDPDIQITRRMLYDYYGRHRDDKYTKNKKVQMQVLAEPFDAFLPPGPPSEAALTRAKDAARKEIEAAQAELRQNVDFTEVVKARSKGLQAVGGDGIWPLMEAGSFKETKVEEAAFALGQGQVSDLLETAAGFFLVKVLKVEAGAVTSFEDAQEEIEGILREEQSMVLRSNYLSSKIKNRNLAQEKEARDKALDKAVERYWRR